MEFLVILYPARPAPEKARRIGGLADIGYNYFECRKRSRWKKFMSLAQTRWNRGTDVPMRVIRRWARQVAERFKPDKIILFGSHAYGTPHEDSDVDILVIMPARNTISQAAKIRWECPVLFPMDLIVRTPRDLRWRIAEGESFHTEILTKGKVLYEKGHARLGAKGGQGLSRRRKGRSRQRPTS
jgi:predicted nucleotidyltransferase